MKITPEIELELSAAESDTAFAAILKKHGLPIPNGGVLELGKQSEPQSSLAHLTDEELADE